MPGSPEDEERISQKYKDDDKPWWDYEWEAPEETPKEKAMKVKYKKFQEKHSPRFPNTTLPEDYKLDDID